jgi:hypothetical protein
MNWLKSENCKKIILTKSGEDGMSISGVKFEPLAMDEQRNKWRLIGDGIGIHWQEVDEDIETASLLAI